MNINKFIIVTKIVIMLKKKIERAGLNEDEIEEIREAFNLFDTENTGKIDPKVFYLKIRNLKLPCKVSDLNKKILQFII